MADNYTRLSIVSNHNTSDNNRSTIFDIVAIAICIVGIVANGPVQWVIFRYRRTTFRNPFYICSRILAVLDSINLLASGLALWIAGFRPEYRGAVTLVSSCVRYLGRGWTQVRLCVKCMSKTWKFVS